jgi:hypothetical protein
MANDRPGRALPLDTHGSPVDVSPGPAADDLWWKPGWPDIIRSVGWHWILVLPAAGVIALCVMGFFRPHYLGLFWWLGFKGLVWALAIPVMLLADVARRATGARKEPFCIHCGYTLTGLPNQGLCPECGSVYSPAMIDEYRRDPKWFIQRFKAQKNLPKQDVPLPPVSFVGGKRRRSRDGT